MDTSYRKLVLSLVVIFVCSLIVSFLAISNDVSGKIATIKSNILDTKTEFKGKHTTRVLVKQTPEEYLKLPMCPEKPAGLKNNVQPDVRLKAYEDDPSVLQHVQPGGSYRPLDCRAREHVAIVVPMRGREEHLRKLVIHLHQFLPKQKISYRIFVAEMAEGATFNTGLMQNVGFQIADRTDNFTCFIIHDVDLLPTNENNLYTCDKVPLHIATNNSKYNYRKLYHGYFGGVITLGRNMYIKANGFSNLYFGWGSQDDDFRGRLVHVGHMPRDRERNVGVYEALPHKQDSGNPVNEGRGRFVKSITRRLKLDGLNTLQYKLLKQEDRELYTWALAEVNQTQVMAPFENYS